MLQRRKGFTTVVDLSEFEKMTWSHLTNVKMTWEYDGLAYLLREAGIALYGIERGTMKMNHPIICMAVPQHRDRNYGVDIYVPSDQLARARKLIADGDRMREAAELEAQVGQAAHEEFERAALEARERNRAAKRKGRR